jgi:hypothetical protein
VFHIGIPIIQLPQEPSTSKTANVRWLLCFNFTERLFVSEDTDLKGRKQLDSLIWVLTQLDALSNSRSKPIKIINIGRTCSRSDNIISIILMIKNIGRRNEGMRVRYYAI